MAYPNLQPHERVNWAQQNKGSLAGVEALNRREAANRSAHQQSQIPYPILRRMMSGELQPSKDRPFLALLALIGIFLALPVNLAIAWFVGAGAYTEFGVGSWTAAGIGAVVFLAVPWLCQWTHFSGVNLQRRGNAWYIPFKPLAFAAAFGVSAYLGTIWSWAGIDVLEIALTANERLYGGIGIGTFWGLAVYVALTQSR